MHNEYDKKSKDDNIAKHSLSSTSFYLSTLFKPTFPAHFSKQHFPGHFTNNILLPGISPTPKNMFCKCVTIYKVGGVEVLSKFDLHLSAMMINVFKTNRHMKTMLLLHLFLLASHNLKSVL